MKEDEDSVKSLLANLKRWEMKNGKRKWLIEFRQELKQTCNHFRHFPNEFEMWDAMQLCYQYLLAYYQAFLQLKPLAEAYESEDD